MGRLWKNTQRPAYNDFVERTSWIGNYACLMFNAIWIDAQKTWGEVAHKDLPRIIDNSTSGDSLRQWLDKGQRWTEMDREFNWAVQARSAAHSSSSFSSGTTGQTSLPQAQGWWWLVGFTTGGDDRLPKHIVAFLGSNQFAEHHHPWTAAWSRHLTFILAAV